MVDSNIQREHIKPVERGYAYKMRLDAMTHQGKKVDDYNQDVGIEYSKSTSVQVGQKLASVDILGQMIGETRNQIRRFIRLTYLIKPIQKMVNEESETGLKMAFNPAVELSYLSTEHQEVLFKLMSQEQVTPSLAQCQELKRKAKSGELDTDFIYDIIKLEKPNQRERISIDTKQINRYFPKNFTMKQKQDLIVKLLREWDQKQKNVQTR
jgi:ParB family chromosome partitioning protein